MSGRVLFILSLLFIIIAALTYDFHVREVGGQTGLSHLIDEVKGLKLPNLKSFFNPQPPAQDFSLTTIQSQFPNLQRDCRELKERRTKTIESRQALLDQWRATNHDFVKELASYEHFFYRKQNLWDKYQELKQNFQSMNYEYDFLKENIEATENTLEKLLSSVEDHLRNLVIEVITFHPEDLLKLTDFYFPLRQNERNLSANLQQHYQYFENKQKALNERIDGFLAVLKETKDIDTAALEISFHGLKTKQSDLFEKLKLNATNFAKFCDEENITYEDFMNGMAKSIHVDLNQLLEQRRRQAQAAQAHSQEK